MGCRHVCMLLTLVVAMLFTVGVVYREAITAVVLDQIAEEEVVIIHKRRLDEEETVDVLLEPTRKVGPPPEDNMVNMVVTYAYVLDLDRPELNLALRQHEFTDTLWRNLNHGRVWSVHVLFSERKHVLYLLAQFRHIAAALNFTADYIDDLILQKLFLSPLRQPFLYYKDAFEYANENLTGLVCWVGNSDIYLGDGWENINVTHMRLNKRAYTLTRAENCTDKKESCSKGQSAGFGGADGFVVISPVPPKALVHMDHPTNVLGAENNAAWQLTAKANLTLTNPCEILNTYHNHCSDIRPKQTTERVNGGFSGGRGDIIIRPSLEL